MTTSIPFIEETKAHADLVNTCARIFNHPELREEDLAVYLSAIPAMNAQEICDALVFWISSERRFPFPLDIRSLIIGKRRWIENQKTYPNVK